MKIKLNKVWESATLMTWLSYSTKALSLFAVLPLILTKFSDVEINLWYLFSSIIVLSALLDFGFRSTFTRIIAFAFAGAKHIGVFNGNEVTDVSPNWELIEKIFSTMKTIYFWLSILILVLALSLGTLSMIRPIGLIENQNQAWLAWLVIVFSSTIKFYGVVYQNYLEGLNKIALVRKIEAIMSLGLIVSSVTVLLYGGSLLHLVIVFQSWGILNTVRNWILSRRIYQGKIKEFRKKPFEKQFFLEVWKPAWRSGISGFMSIGLTNLTGILYAQVGSVEIIGSYLLSLRIIEQVKEISMAPFYSKIPVMSTLRVKGEKKKLISVAQKGMAISHWVFILGCIIVALFSEELLSLIGSNVLFVTPSFWILLSFAYLAHRYGAMHMQLYLTTNDVKSHIADGVSGIIFIIVSLLLIKRIDIYAFPIGMISGYLGFYAIYSSRLSLNNLSLSFFRFEIKSVLIPFLCFLIFVIAFLI